MGLSYFDKHGNLVETEKTKQMIKANIIKASKNARTVIGIAGGMNKVPIIDVALSLHLFTAFLQMKNSFCFTFYFIKPCQKS